jgi:hypothetical protein
MHHNEADSCAGSSVATGIAHYLPDRRKLGGQMNAYNDNDDNNNKLMVNRSKHATNFS